MRNLRRTGIEKSYGREVRIELIQTLKLRRKQIGNLKGFRIRVLEVQEDRVDYQQRRDKKTRKRS